MSAVAASSRLNEETIPFTAHDGFACNLIHVWGDRTPDKGPVLLVHGAGVRANIFRAPVETDIVAYLIDHGYDVWLENWRASIDLASNDWTLDQAARFDHPAAVARVVEATGAAKIKAVIHCQGSTSFTMSAMAGLVPQVETILTNAVSLHTVVPPWSRTKIRLALPVVKAMTDQLNPAWGLDAPTLPAKLINGFVRLTHHECDNLVCKHVSFTYGSGFPALWSHDNLDEATHEWLKGEFARVPLTFFDQIKACIARGHLVSLEPGSDLPEDFAAQPPRTEARFAFFAGEDNLCFLPESQRQSFAFFDRHRPGYHSLTVLPRYGHLDMFMGKWAARDVFPKMVAELDKPNQ